MTIENALHIPAGTWNLDPSHSEVGFTVRHAGISKVRGKFESTTAVAEVPETNVLDTSVKAVISTASFNSGNADRDNHVKSADFFDVEQFPEMAFESTSLDATGGRFILQGNLTIKGETRPVSLDVEFNGIARDPFGLLRGGVEARTNISRKDFGLTWNAALEAGGVLVSDKVALELELSFILDESE